MRLFLQIDINDWRQRSYTKPFSNYAPSLASDLMAADLDNQSEPAVTDLIFRLVNEAEQVFVLVYAEPGAALGGSLKLFQHFFSVEDKMHALVLCGKNEAAEKMLRPFQEKYKTAETDETIKKLIEEFAKAKA